MQAADSGVLLAFDFGLRRIGIATANRITGTANPLETLKIGAEVPWERVDALVTQWRPGRLLVGLPSSQTAPELAAAASDFAATLGDRYRLPVSTVDETLTSRAAQSELIMARKSGLMKKKIRKESLDSHAACLIAEQWLREQ